MHTAQWKVTQARQQTAVTQEDVEQAARWLTVAQHQAEPLQLSPQRRQSCQEQLALYRRLEDADEIHREMLDREREQAQTVAAAAVGKDLPAAEDIEVVFAEYTLLLRRCAAECFLQNRAVTSIVLDVSSGV